SGSTVFELHHAPYPGDEWDSRVGSLSTVGSNIIIRIQTEFEPPQVYFSFPLSTPAAFNL
ncbi:hypothetical protein P3E18_27140, partial [Pseudomonas aeruginosa]